MANKLSRLDLVKKVEESTSLSNKDSEKAVNATINAIKEILKAGDEVTIVGFGTFSTHARKETEARNPQNGEKIKVPAKTVAKFKASKKFFD